MLSGEASTLAKGSLGSWCTLRFGSWGRKPHPSHHQIFTQRYLRGLIKGALWLALVGLVQVCGHLSKHASGYQPQGDTGFRCDPAGLLRGSPGKAPVKPGRLPGSGVPVIRHISLCCGHGIWRKGPLLSRALPGIPVCSGSPHLCPLKGICLAASPQGLESERRRRSLKAECKSVLWPRSQITKFTT